MKEGKTCHWASQGPSHHEWLQCLKKRQHSCKNTIFGKDFRDHITESLKAETQYIEATAEVSKSNNRKRPFREGPSFDQGRPNAGKNSDRNTMVNTFCSKRKEPLYSHSQISLPVMVNMVELTHVHPILKK